MTHANSRANGQSREGGCMLVPCMIAKNPCPLLVWEPQEGRQRLSGCLLLFAFVLESSCSRARPVLKISCSLWQCLWDRLWQMWGTLGSCFKDPTGGHKLVTWESYIWKSLSAAQKRLAGGVHYNLSLCCWGRKDSLCQGQIYLGSFVLVRPFRPSFDLIYLLILELYYVQDSAALFSFFFLYFTC